MMRFKAGQIIPPSLMSLEGDDGCIGGAWCKWVMEDCHMTYDVGHHLASASQGDPK